MTNGTGQGSILRQPQLLLPADCSRDLVHHAFQRLVESLDAKAHKEGESGRGKRHDIAIKRSRVHEHHGNRRQNASQDNARRPSLELVLLVLVAPGQILQRLEQEYA